MTRLVYHGATTLDGVLADPDDLAGVAVRPAAGPARALSGEKVVAQCRFIPMRCAGDWMS
jgi:hypothetical protein